MVAPRINEQIDAASVLVINADGSLLGERTAAQALKLARDSHCDLVEVQPGDERSVCRFMPPDDARLFAARGAERSLPPLEFRTLVFRTTGSDVDVRLRIRHARAHLAAGGGVEFRVEGPPDEAERLIDRLCRELRDVATPTGDRKRVDDESIVFLHPRSITDGVDHTAKE